MVVSFSIYKETDISCWNICIIPQKMVKIVDWVDVL
jgi:hypothetical protein